MARALRRVALVVLVILVGGACEEDPARLALELEGPAAAEPLVFHGSCLAGWSVRATLRVRETGGTDARIDALTYYLRDEGLGEDIVSESLDASSIVGRYGTDLVAARSSRLLPVSGPFGSRPVGPIVVSGELRGHDENAKALRTPYRLEAASLVVHEPDLGPGGACP